MCNKSNMKSKTLLIMLFAFAFFAIFWILRASNSLTMDDFTTISVARFNEYSELFRLFPARSYNDRSLGLMFVKVLNDMFDSNYKMYHYSFVLVHLFNIAIIYRIGLKIFKKDENNYIYAILMSAVFGIYPVSLMTVQWISAVYDLICCLFILLSILFYLKAMESDKYRIFYGILTVLFYYFSLRSKEMALVLPVIVIMYEVTKAIMEKKRFQITWFLCFNLIFMFIYAWMLFTSGMKDIPVNNPYYQSFNPINLFRNAVRYLIIYCDLGNSGFTYVGLTKGSIPLLIIFIFIMLFSIIIIKKFNDFSLFFSILCSAGSLTVVLPMVNMQHRLYLYIPSIFIGISCALFFKALVQHFKIKNIWECIFVIIPALYLLSYMPGIVEFKESWKGFCSKDDYTIAQMQKIQAPAKESNIYIKGASNGYNTFFYGPGNSIKLLFDDQTLKPVLVDEFPVEPQKPYVFWTYDNGNVVEVARDITQISKDEGIKIMSVYPTEIIKGNTKLNNDGSIFISTTCNKINSKLSIVVNGKTLSTTIGKEFISAVVPADMLNNQMLEVYVIDKNNDSMSDKIIVPIS